LRNRYKLQNTDRYPDSVPLTAARTALLPDATLRLVHHRLPGVAGRGALEFRHVRDNAIDRKVWGRMAVAGRGGPQGGNRHICARDRRKSEEEALLGGILGRVGAHARRRTMVADNYWMSSRHRRRVVSRFVTRIGARDGLCRRDD
jgi:hypothetical protein